MMGGRSTASIHDRGCGVHLAAADVWATTFATRPRDHPRANRRHHGPGPDRWGGTVNRYSLTTMIDNRYRTRWENRMPNDDVLVEVGVSTSQPTQSTRDRKQDAMVFLQGVLATGPAAATDIEARARAAGLLSDRQDISHAKRFKHAKAALGIASIRQGFGRNGEWAWVLPPPAEVPAPQAEGQLSTTSPVINAEPKVSVIYGGAVSSAEPNYPKMSSAIEPANGLPYEFRDVVGVPRNWLEGVPRLQGHRNPRDVPPHRWRQIVTDCYRFIVSGEGWAQRAADLGWDALALFGCHRTIPLMYLGCAGLLWFVDGGRIVRLHADWAEIAANGRSRTHHRRRAVVTLPWLLR